MHKIINVSCLFWLHKYHDIWIQSNAIKFGICVVKEWENLINNIINYIFDHFCLICFKRILTSIFRYIDSMQAVKQHMPSRISLQQTQISGSTVAGLYGECCSREEGKARISKNNSHEKLTRRTAWKPETRFDTQKSAGVAEHTKAEETIPHATGLFCRCHRIWEAHWDLVGEPVFSNNYLLHQARTWETNPKHKPSMPHHASSWHLFVDGGGNLQP